jgi:sugar phosphate isomerase/epimerase
MTIQTRRTFLATLGVAALGIAGKDATAASEILAPRRKIKRIGLQLYTVRDLMKADLPGTLAKVAAIGYKEVEFHDYFGHTPRQVRQLLRRNGLTAPSTHRPFELLESGWQKALDDWKRHAALFNRAAAQAKAVGLRFGYHNHDVEIRKIGDMRPLDLLLKETDPSLVDFEMDLYWVTFAGGDPLDFFNRYPKRFPLVHVKDSSVPPDKKIVDVGQGTIDFRSIFAQSDKAGIKHYFVEHDEPADPIATIRNSYKYLHALTY